MNYKIRTFALLLAVVAGNSARAQQPIYAQVCKSYTFTGTAANGTGVISYQWYRDGQPIPNATSVSYTLPAQEAYGENVEFKRGVMSSGCPGEVAFSTVFQLTFSGLKIDNICWANTNVDAPNTFATKSDMYTKFYQWNRETAWSATDVTVSDWNGTPDLSETWAANPCPNGWRLPTHEEFIALHNSGSTWVNAGTRGAAVNGRFYGSKHETCALPNNMYSCIFLPAVGYRTYDYGVLSNQGVLGYYWSSTLNTAYDDYNLNFSNSNSNPNGNLGKADGRNIRCVR